MIELKLKELFAPLSLGQHDTVYYEDATSLVYIPRQILNGTTMGVLENDVLVEALKAATLIGISTDGLTVELPDNETAGLLVLTSEPPVGTGDYTITWFGDYDWLNTGSMIVSDTDIPIANNSDFFMNTVDFKPTELIPADGYISKLGMDNCEVHFANNTATLLSDLIATAYCQARTMEKADSHEQVFFIDRFHSVPALTSTLKQNAFIHVIDCLSDPDVEDGPALYVWLYESESLVKIVEFNDLDKRRHWDDILRGPNNMLIADILPASEFDSMVDLIHQHHPYSIETLETIGSNVAGNLTYNDNELAEGFVVDPGYENWDWLGLVH